MRADMRRLTLLLFALSLIGCGTQPHPSASVDSRVTTTAAAESGASRSLAVESQPVERAPVIDITTPDTIEDDPSQQGWQTESFAAVIEERLKHLPELIVPSDQQYALAAETYRGEALRPKALETVVQTPEWTVRRWSPGESVSTRDSESFASGSEALVRSLRDLVSHVDAVAELRTKIKIFGVRLEDQQATTDLYFQLYAKHSSGSLQVNATWQCIWTTDQSPQLQTVRLLAYEEINTHVGDQPMFVDRTASVLSGPVYEEQLRYGVDYWLTRIDSSCGIDINGWQGIAIADVNGDGLDDAYLCQPGGLPNRLYVQNADGTATETSAAAGVDWLDSTHAALFVDLDNDGDQDLLVGVNAGVLIMGNDGQGRFTPRASMVLPAALPYAIAAADVDVDGDLDAYVCCYNRRQGINRHLLFARPVPYHDANNGGRNVLLVNEATPANGRWQFSYGTGRLGLDQNNRRFSFAASWEDYDNDGDLDLYVANDFGRNNLFQNVDGNFSDVAAAAGVEDIGPGMSACWGDYNNDGQMDLYVSNMFSSAGNRVTQQRQFQASADDQTRSDFRRHARGNSLFQNRGNGSFQDVAVPAGVVLGRWAWGSSFADLNRDGWLDLIVANGFITQDDTGDL